MPDATLSHAGNPTCCDCELVKYDGFELLDDKPDLDGLIDHVRINSLLRLGARGVEEKLHKALQAVCEKLNQQEQATNVSTHTPEPSRRFNIIYGYDDDDKENTIPLNEITYQIPPSIAITPVLPTMEPEDSLIMGDENLSTIPKKESDEVIKSSVKDLVPIPSESEDTSDNDKNIESKDSYVSNLDEPALLVTPLSDFNEYDCFDPGGDVDEIELLLHRDPSTPKISVASILEGFTDESPLEENNDLFDLETKENEWKKILYDALIDDLMTEDKVFDPRIPEKFFSPTYVSLPFEDRHYLSLTHVI
ncbi:hypothetical protein Tco_0701846 [Tanacetum coccineum]|uniref:Reverse transcriptase domain-containing protein n=1 Tax=Tanacetum coccineum TaxID=301880 RepID=A0ABQ4XVE4_9ASTR